MRSRKYDSPFDHYRRGYLECMAINIRKYGVQQTDIEGFQSIGSPDAKVCRDIGVLEKDREAINELRRFIKNASFK